MFVRLAGHSLAANESGFFDHSTVLGRRLANPEAIGLVGPLPSRCGPRIFSEPFFNHFSGDSEDAAVKKGLWAVAQVWLGMASWVA